MGRPSSARAVDVHIAQLRAKLGAELSAVIRTVRGVGYILDTPMDTHRRGQTPGCLPCHSDRPASISDAP